MARVGNLARDLLCEYGPLRRALGPQKLLQRRLFSGRTAEETKRNKIDFSVTEIPT